MEHEESTHVRDESSGTVREESSTLVNDTGAAPVREASVVKSSTPARRAMEGIYLLFGVIDALLLIRLVLKLLGANPHVGFASFTYGLTDFFLAPFKGLLPTFVSGQSVFELSLIFAILIYSLIALGLVRLVAITLSRSVMVSQHSRSEGLKPRSG
ncbi:MAG TPA: YggT family protein [Candidatus Nitrosopolaris sp.]|nr:YggT family protein [Candidatus Nitrosopolaris sp.]